MGETQFVSSFCGQQCPTKSGGTGGYNWGIGNGSEGICVSLTEVAIRKIKPQGKQYKLSDSGGLYLLVKPDGAKYWRLKYRHAGKEKLLALGVYPQGHSR
jgi:hypothetical protein